MHTSAIGHMNVQFCTVISVNMERFAGLNFHGFNPISFHENFRGALRFTMP